MVPYLFLSARARLYEQIAKHMGEDSQSENWLSTTTHKLIHRLNEMYLEDNQPAAWVVLTQGVKDYVSIQVHYRGVHPKLGEWIDGMEIYGSNTRDRLRTAYSIERIIQRSGIDGIIGLNGVTTDDGLHHFCVDASEYLHPTF